MTILKVDSYHFDKIYELIWQGIAKPISFKFDEFFFREISSTTQIIDQILVTFDNLLNSNAVGVTYQIEIHNLTTDNLTFDFFIQ